MAEPREISLVFQGPVVGTASEKAQEQVTRRCLESARRVFPEAEIILSTWEGSDITGLKADKVLLNKDPGGWKRDDGIACNINRQIVSTREGLKAASRTYAAKLRTDTEIKNGNFAAIERSGAARRPEWSVFAERVLILERYTRDPAKMPLLHHPSDLFQFGRREDLRMLWDVALNTAADYQSWETRHARPRLRPFSDKRIFQHHADEQYVWLQCVAKRKRIADLDYLWQMRFKEIAVSEGLLTANFSVVSNQAAGIELPERFATHGWPQTCYQSGAWAGLTEVYQGDGQAVRRWGRRVHVFAKAWHGLAMSTLAFRNAG